MDELNANFDELLKDEPQKKEHLFDMSEELEDKKQYKINPIKYHKGSPVIYERDEYIVIISNRNLTIINTLGEHNNHIHINIKSNKKGEVNLNLSKYLIDCVINKKYPKSEWMVSYLLRLTCDEEYISFLSRKRKRNKNKQKYTNRK